MEVDPTYDEDNVDECEVDDIYIGKPFADENEAYDTYNAYALRKGFEICKSWITKSRTDRLVLQGQFDCNKEGHKCRDKRQEG